MKRTLLIKYLSVIAILAIIIGILPDGNKAFCSSAADAIVDDDGNEMYTVPATLYDYKSDSELINGAIDNYYNNGAQWNGYNHYGFEQFNSKLAQYFEKNEMDYPMYFGDFNLKKSTMSGESLYKYYWSINRAIRESDSSDMSAAVQGLVDDKLKDGKITQNNVELPYFNEDFLSNTKSNDKSIGKVVKTRFPFRETTYNGIAYYEFDSTDGNDNVWLDGNDLKYSRNKSKHAVWDANHLMVKGAMKDEIGFFPFNNHEKEGLDDKREKLNFGFGVRMDIKFNIPKGGIVRDSDSNNQDVIFEFTGDDDVWIFIDGKLVLDIGGQHKKSKGTINFNSTKNYSKVDKVLNGSIKGSEYQNIKEGDKVSLADLGLDFSDPIEEHTISLFYMERGMIQSNMKIRYNFKNNNIVQVGKKVDNSKVNEGLKEATNIITSKEDFDFNIMSVNYNNKETPLESCEYKLNNSDKVTEENGGFTLKDKDNALFLNAIARKGAFRIKEVENKKYDTSIEINNGQEDGTGNVISGTDTGKVYCLGGDSLLEKSSVEFTNKVKTGDLTITKDVDEYVKNRFDGYQNDEFTFQVKLKNIFGDIASNEEYSIYNLHYSIDGGDTKIAEDGKIRLKVGQVAKISGIPIGTEYSIEEIEYPNRYAVKDKYKTTGTIIEEVATNSKITNGAAKELYNLVIKKTIDDKYYNSGDKFTKNESYAGLTSAEQSFIFTIKQYDKPYDNPERKLVNKFKEVISFNNSDSLSKEKIIKNLPKGYYEVSEDTDWSWKYEFKSVSVKEQGTSQYSYAKAENIDLGYSIKDDPTVEFINSIKYSKEEHDKVPEGDTAIEKNILKK